MAGETSTADSNDKIRSPSCHTCFRSKKAGDTEFLNLADGRKLCSDCTSISIFPQEREECSFIIQKVYEFFKSCGLQVNENIPILFIDKNQMSRIISLYYKDPVSAEGIFHQSVSTCIQCLSAYDLPLPERLCGERNLKWLYCVETSLARREAYTRSGVNIAKPMFFLGDMIMVLYGKPDVELGGLLAHEIMHGWFFSKGYYPWGRDRSIDEGICQVMYYKWLDWFSSKGFNSSNKTNEQVQYTRKLKEKLAFMIRWNDDEVYGQGFRNAMRAIQASGFEATLDHILKKGTLPPVVTTTMKKKTTSAAIIELLWKAARSKTNSLWKEARSRTISSWKASTVTITNLLLKVTAKCETPRFVAMEGQRHHHYHEGQSHNNIHASMFFGILVEHK